MGGNQYNNFFIYNFGGKRPSALATVGSRTLAQDSGWSVLPHAETGGVQHDGFFHAAGQRWRGAVIENAGFRSFRILQPPIGYIRGTQWEGCFHAIGRDGWWQITFVPILEPKDVDSGLVAITKILQQCFKQAAQRRSLNA